MRRRKENSFYVHLYIRVPPDRGGKGPGKKGKPPKRPRNKAKWSDAILHPTRKQTNTPKQEAQEERGRMGGSGMIPKHIAAACACPLFMRSPFPFHPFRHFSRVMYKVTHKGRGNASAFPKRSRPRSLNDLLSLHPPLLMQAACAEAEKPSGRKQR